MTDRRLSSRGARPTARRRVRVGLTAVATLAVAVGGLTATAGTALAATTYPRAAVITADDAQHEASVVAAEDARLTEIRTVSSLARWQNKNWKTPYRLSTGSGFTLVLTPGNEPYTLTQLRQLAPQTFVPMSDGSYLLSENIAVMAGATLSLSQPGGLHLRLASGSAGFATIVSFGGRLAFTGESGSPLTITSWDAHSGQPDTDTVDGRAYIRAIGGQFQMTYTDVSNLGFWSGRTGGIALTGTSRPNTGAVESLRKVRRLDNGVPTVTDNLGAHPITPAGPLPSGTPDPRLKFTVPDMDYVSTQIDHSTITGDAFGLFVSGADGVQIADSAVRDSLISGVELHRFVTSGAIERTVSSHNVGDGFNLDRATEGILISESTANDNSANGFVVSGRPLSDGPSPTGSSLASYGNNSVSNSTATGNARDGIEVIGGFNVGVQNNRVSDSDMGIVVTSAAVKVSITGNEVTHEKRHGIALTNGISDTTVTGNVIAGTPTGVYLRDSKAKVQGNTVTGASAHGISVVGKGGGTSVSNNVLSGSGLSAINTTRSSGTLTVADNATTAWHDTSPWYVRAKMLLHPMTLLWAAIGLLVLVSAIRGRRRNDAIVHPYAEQMAHQMPVMVPSPRFLDLRDHAVSDDLVDAE